MIHFRYFDNNFTHNYLWEDLSEACEGHLASAEAVEQVSPFLQALENGVFSAPVVWVLHFHEPHPEGTGYYRLDAATVARWQTPTRVYYVTGGEVQRVQQHLQQEQLPANVLAYPHSLSFVQQWSPLQLAEWQACFQRLAEQA